ncbi:MAG: hypothetical protein ACYDA8_12455, partial [Deferrisomatales bacterium]
MGAVLVVLAAAGAVRSAAALQWARGFPLRAGENVLLVWEPAAGAVRYVVTRRDAASGALKEWETPTNQHVDLDAPSSRTFVYSVRAVGPDGAAGPATEERRLEGFRPLDPPRWVGQ